MMAPPPPSSDRVRGDGDVLALLDEMAAGSTASGDGGGGGGGPPSPSSPLARSSLPPPNDDDRSTTATAATAAAIATLRSALSLCPPSDPGVEVLRRRCHERFKAEFYEAFRDGAPPPGGYGARKGAAGGSGRDGDGGDAGGAAVAAAVRTLWRSIPPHGIWERYQFSLKVLEAECVREAQEEAARDGGCAPPWRRSGSAGAPLSGAEWADRLARDSALREVRAWTAKGREAGTVWEPLMPVSSVSSLSRDHQSEALRRIERRYRGESFELLREEVEFGFRRAFRRARGGEGGGRKGSDGSKGELMRSIDELRDSLREAEVSVGPDGLEEEGNQSASSKGEKRKKKKKKEKKKSNRDSHDGAPSNEEEEDERVSKHLFSSRPFQNSVRKLHRNFLNLAEDRHDAFLSELRKRADRQVREEQSRASSGRRKRKRGRGDDGGGSGGGGGTPKIALVLGDDDGDVDDERRRERQYAVTFEGVSLRINEAHLDKLRRLYRRTLANLGGRDVDDDGGRCDGGREGHPRGFARALFVALCRYDALEGAGLQSAIPPAVFRFLDERFGGGAGVRECFASPFNCYFREGDGGTAGGEYGSAFGDVDAAFQSAGSFFDADFREIARSRAVGGKGCCFQANPPFAPAFIDRMRRQMHECLGRLPDDSENMNSGGDEGGEEPPMTFVVFVPAWTDAPGWKSLKSSPYLVRHVFLSQKHDPHYYAEGTQHRRRRAAGGRGGDDDDDGHRIASFDTSVFFLQNDAARARWMVKDEDEQRLRRAFALRLMKNGVKGVREEVVQRRDGTKERSNGTSRKMVGGTRNSDADGGTIKVGAFKRLSSKESRQKTAAGSTQRGETRKQQKDSDNSQKAAKDRCRKKQLMDGGSDEMGVLASLGLLDEGKDSTVEGNGKGGRVDKVSLKKNGKAPSRGPTGTERKKKRRRR
ncbi:hypothetical protein ACHAWF_016814 [Thalassiosira exigua]